jgi:hypothetical protein
MILVLVSLSYLFSILRLENVFNQSVKQTRLGTRIFLNALQLIKSVRNKRLTILQQKTAIKNAKLATTTLRKMILVRVLHSYQISIRRREHVSSHLVLPIVSGTS